MQRDNSKNYLFAYLYRINITNKKHCSLVGYFFIVNQHLLLQFSTFLISIKFYDRYLIDLTNI